MPSPPVPAIWVVNASPFIGLAKAGLLPTLIEAGRTVLMPAAVAGEVRNGPALDAAVQALAALPNGLTILPTVPILPPIVPFGLDSGESAVLTETLARPGSVAIIDESRARAAAVTLGIQVTGSLGLLILAKSEGRLSALAPAIHALKAAGIFLPGESRLSEILQAFSETWP